MRGEPASIGAKIKGYCPIFAARGRILAAASQLARDLANMPPAYLTARRFAEVASAVAANRELGIEVFDEDALANLGCEGLLGVNAGSVERPHGSRPKASARCRGLTSISAARCTPRLTTHGGRRVGPGLAHVS
jgi:hypothetical protein